MEIKNILIAIRESNGYSKRTVSEMTGIPYTTYIKYESGERKDVSMYALCKLADFYHVTTDYLLGRLDGNLPADPMDEFVSKTNMKEQEQIILKKWLALNDRQRQAVFDFMADFVHECESKLNEKATKTDKNTETVSNDKTAENDLPYDEYDAGELEDKCKAEQNAQKDVS